MNLTSDQLAYILERRYLNIKIGTDVVIKSTASQDPDHPYGWRNNKDAEILEWKVQDYPEPSEQEISRLWGILEDQYNSDPYRMDSQMFLFTITSGGTYTKPKIIINGEL
jgi:hypothetical protein